MTITAKEFEEQYSKQVNISIEDLHDIYDIRIYKCECCENHSEDEPCQGWQMLDKITARSYIQELHDENMKEYYKKYYGDADDKQKEV